MTDNVPGTSEVPGTFFYVTGYPLMGRSFNASRTRSAGYS